MLKLSKILAGWSPAEAANAHDPVALLEAGWREIVGDDVARNSRPVRIAEGTLTITTRSSAWSHQLSFLAEHVLRAVKARVPGTNVAQLRFRVGRLSEQTPRRISPRPLARSPRPARPRGEAASPAEALARFREEVEGRRQLRRKQGWNECESCAALVAPGAPELCAACRSTRTQALAAATARLLYEAPWLGFAGTAALVDGLKEADYERVRSRMLAHWWGMLARARATRRIARDGRERLVASSYVLLQSKLPPEAIMPATVRSILGEELHDLLYGEASDAQPSLVRTKA
jgi:Dna[CI] antecedent, DciA